MLRAALHSEEVPRYPHGEPIKDMDFHNMHRAYQELVCACCASMCVLLLLCACVCMCMCVYLYVCMLARKILRMQASH